MNVRTCWMCFGLLLFLAYNLAIIHYVYTLRQHNHVINEDTRVPFWMKYVHGPERPSFLYFGSSADSATANNNKRAKRFADDDTALSKEALEEILLTRDTDELQTLFEANCMPTTNKVPALGRRLRVLFLTHHFHNYQGMMDRHFFHQYEAASRHPCVDAHLWGHDFQGYVNKLHLKQNLINKFGSVYFDVIWIFGIVPNEQIIDVSRDGNTAIVLHEHSCKTRKCINVINGNNATLTFMTYAQDVPLYTQDTLDRHAPKLIVHSPHTVRTEIFNAGSDIRRSSDQQRRAISVLLSGNLAESTYPIRTRFRKLIEAGKIPGALLREHPGYAEFFNEKQRAEKKISAHSTEQQVLDYAEQLRSAKIAIVDSSIHKYALRNYIEAAQAGCLLIGDIPLEREEEFRKYVVEVSPKDSDEKLLETITYWLTHSNERVDRASVGQQIAVAKYDMQHSITRLIHSFLMWKRREFGIVLPYPFRVVAPA